MNFVRRFLHAWKHARNQAQLDELADDPKLGWTRDDALFIGGMLNHPSGQKWMRRLNNVVIRLAVDATKRSLNPRFHCGKARGAAELKSFIDGDYITALSLASAQSGNHEKSEDERDADNLEQLLSQVL